MYLHQRRPGLLFIQLIVTAGIISRSYTFAAVRSTAAEPIVPKELKMQAPTDPQNPPKSRPAIPETVGATSAPFELGKHVTTISFEIHAPTGPALVRPDGQPKRVLLRIENLKSTSVAPTFDVYLNLPSGEIPEKRPDLFAFTMSTFGLLESSQTREHHPGNGLNFVQDVTQLFMRLPATTHWDGKILHVSFVPAPWKNPISVQVGRVSLMLE